MSSRTKALIAIVLAALLGATAGMAKIIIRLTDPYVVAFLRFFVASVVILPFFLRVKRKSAVSILAIVPLALASCANIGFYYLGLQTSTANAATLIYAGVPLITLILANTLLREPLTIRKFLGILLGLIGVVVIVLLPIVEHGGQVSGTFPGNFYFVGATIVWSLYTVGSRYAITAKGYSPLVISSVSIFTTCIMFFFISLFTFQSAYLPQLINTNSILIILHLGIMVTVAMYFLFQLGIQYSSATTASLGNYFGPVFAILFNVVLLGESVTPVFIIGSMLVLTGVIITSGTGVLHEARRWIHR